MNVYLVADVQVVIEREAPLPPDAEIRPISCKDIPALADLYHRAYDSVSETINDAIAEMQSAFDGSWGELWPDASPSLWLGDRVIAAAQTVRRASWDTTPWCPWIIEVFTDPFRRREGFARALINAACRAIAADGEREVGLTVDESNGPAIALYRSLGFTQMP